MKKIGIIGAMELEVETLKSKMNVVKTTKKANMEFFEGVFAVSQSGFLLIPIVFQKNIQFFHQKIPKNKYS